MIHCRNLPYLNTWAGDPSRLSAAIAYLNTCGSPTPPSAQLRHLLLDPVRLVNNGFAFCFKEARLSATIGRDTEINKFCGQLSTIMRVISNKDDDLLSRFDNDVEKDNPKFERLPNLLPQITDTPHHKMLINNHTDAKKGKIKGYLYLEVIFGFCKTFKR